MWYCTLHSLCFPCSTFQNFCTLFVTLLRIQSLGTTLTMFWHMQSELFSTLWASFPFLQCLSGWLLPQLETCQNACHMLDCYCHACIQVQPAVSAGANIARILQPTTLLPAGWTLLRVNWCVCWLLASTGSVSCQRQFKHHRSVVWRLIGNGSGYQGSRGSQGSRASGSVCCSCWHFCWGGGWALIPPYTYHPYCHYIW